ncbi:hypothetical protein [Pseudomonas savastanoi]|uniref:Uncharacterized protein n=1 Tax=Pseudomonas savastanoi TaxID=29438 RepID=A0AAW3M1T3_PSESS|nr:hypothetical protein [Pseudomonas savastanoi]KTC60149.1 hypothetical protein AO287_17815 [Pseudomonas savastanoi]
MATKITVGQIVDCGIGIGISESWDSDMKISVGRIDRCKIAILQGDPIAAMAALSIPQGVPRDEVREVLHSLAEAGDVTEEEKASLVKRSKFWAHVKDLSEAAAIVKGLVSLAASSLKDFDSIL